MLDPPQVPASGVAGLRSLSPSELAEAWVRALKSQEDSRPILHEFRRRYWEHQAEAAEAGDVLRIEPAFRPLHPLEVREVLRGVQAFAA